MEQAAKEGLTNGLLPYSATGLRLAATPGGRARLLQEFACPVFAKFLPCTKQEGTDFNLFVHGARCLASPRGVDGAVAVDNKGALLKVDFPGKGVKAEAWVDGEKVELDYVPGTPHLRYLHPKP